MNEDNFKFLDKQIKFTGFGEGHSAELKEKMEKKTPEFTIFHSQDFGKDNTVATLQFRKSNEGDMYFFNRYQLMLKNEKQTEPIKQTFFVNAKQDNITLKEGYNLLSGRAVHKEQTMKEGGKYTAWLQLNFKENDKRDKLGNFEIKHYHQNYGFDLEKVLAKHPIKELSGDNSKKMLMDSLERGNRQSVTLLREGKEQKIFIEASPQYKSINFYDSDLKRVHSQTLYEKQGETQSNKESKKENKQQKVNGDDKDDGGKQAEKNNKRKGVKIH